MTVPSALAAASTLVSVLAVGEVRRWWAGGRVAARLGAVTRRRPAPASVERLVERAGVDADPRMLLDLWVATAAVAVAATPIVAGAPVALAVVVVGPPSALVLARNRGARRRTAQIPGALDAIAAALRGGASLPAAIGEAASVGGRLGRELDDVARHVRDGLPIASAVERWARAHDTDADTALAAAALTMAASVGGPSADAVESAAAGLRQRAAAADEVAALSVQARLSALVLSAAPVGFTFLLASLDPGSARFLLATPAGWACIVVGVGLDAAGAWWMHRLVRSAA